MSDSVEKPYIIGIGGSFRADSLSRRALDYTLAQAASLGAEVKLLDADAINFPHYDPEVTERTPEAVSYIEDVRRADGIIISTPAYHGTLSGIVKNAMDYVQDLVSDPSVYFTGRAVGLIATGGGLAGAVTAINTMRTMIHALRGWPTPMAAPIGSYPNPFNEAGELVDAKIKMQLDQVATEVVDFARSRGTAAHKG